MTDLITPGTAGRRRWGKAGQRLTASESAASDHRAGLLRLARDQATERARERWAAGDVVPHRITLALNLRKLFGPQVDEACGVAEPAVDEWEAGVRYPTWDQLLALAALTGFPVGFFTQPVREAPFMVSSTSMVFHRLHGRAPSGDREPLPVLSFIPEAVAATLGGAHRCPTCRRSR